MDQKIASRIEELSSRISKLLEDRESKIQELRQVDSELDTLTAIIFELKSLIEDQSTT
jgi:hypothetical protein